MNLSDATRSKSNFIPTTSSNHVHPNDRKFRRRRTGMPAITGGGIRLRKYYGTPTSRGTGLVTPSSKWKFDDDGGDFSVAGNNVLTTGRRGEFIETISARKLAAALWQLKLGEESAGGGGGSECGPFGRSGDKLKSSLLFHESPMEGATKWDTGCTRISEETHCFYSHVKVLEDQQVDTVSVISALQAELLHARTRIHKLETDRQSSKLKLEHFLKKLDEERTSWRRKEHQKMHKIIGELKEEYSTERSSRKMMEILNSKLVKELADVKLFAKQIGQGYKNERKSRKLTEEVCHELAKEVGEDKAEVEALKRVSLKIREEVQEERKMLQMAEVWREERVQIKLLDAKLTLEEKYNQMNKLITDVETFLRSRMATLDVMEIREAEAILQAVNSTMIPDMNHLSYVAPKSSDIFSIIEELQNGETHNRETKSCITDIPDDNGFNKNPMENHSNGFVNHERGLEEDSRQDDDQGLNASGARTKLFEDAGQESPSTAVSEICSSSLSPKQSKQETSDGEIYKTVPVDCNGRLSNVSISNGETISLYRNSGEGEFSHDKPMGQWSFPDSENPHIARAMKGCIEWPRGLQKQNLKFKLLEARVESQRIQLRHALKQRN